MGDELTALVPRAESRGPTKYVGAVEDFVF
jgi:hypothetical protein